MIDTKPGVTAATIVAACADPANITAVVRTGVTLDMTVMLPNLPTTASATEIATAVREVSQGCEYALLERDGHSVRVVIGADSAYPAVRAAAEAWRP